MDFETRREISEALTAADEAIAHLKSARDSLDSARNWGFFDLLGGGLITTLVKHGKMSDAKDDIYEAQAAVRRFSKELGDIPGIGQMDIEVNDFVSFADIVFDGLIADWLVQSRIDECRHDVNAAIREIEIISRKLRASL